MSPDLLAAYLQAFPDGILVIGEKTEIVLCNRRFLDMWDIPSGIAESQSVEVLLGHISQQLEDPGLFLEHLDSPSEIESRDELILVDGRVIERYATSLRDESGKCARRIWHFRDVSERKALEKELRSSEAQLSEALNIARIGYWVYDYASDEFEFNDQYYALHHTTAEEVGGYWVSSKNFTDSFIYPEDLHWIKDYMQKALESKQGFFAQTCSRILCADGEVRWVWVSVKTVKDSAGQTVKLIGVSQDITEQKEFENNLEHLKLLYKMLSETSAAIVRIRDRDELLETVCRIAGGSGLFRMLWIGFLDKESGNVRPVACWGHEGSYLDNLDINIHHKIKGIAPAGEAIRKAIPVICDNISADPKMHPWKEQALLNGYRSSAAFPLFQGGEVVGVLTIYLSRAGMFDGDFLFLLKAMAAEISFALDFIEANEMRAETELEVARLNVDLEMRVVERTRQLDAANRELEAFNYSVSHDLKSPLRGIEGFSRLLLNDYGQVLDEKGMDYLGRIRRASSHMEQLIDEFLRLSGVSSGELSRSLTDVSRMCREISESLQNSANERHVQFCIEDGIKLHADAKLIRIVLDNLLGNAWKFTAKKEMAKIEVGLVQREGKNVVFVRDNGDGFDMEYAHDLFKPFKRLHGTNEFEGTGIGLATVLRIINRHGGHVWAEGLKGLGAAFYFSLSDS